MPNQDAAGKVNAKGRWDYLPWYWKGYEGTENGPVDNPLYGVVATQPELNPGTPDPSVVPNAFLDTMLVNGTAYPYVKVERKAYRLRVLNGCGDRQLNLQLYYARSDSFAETGPGGTPELQTESGEIAMLPAVPPIGGGWPVRWPTDGRAGGVPDPRAVGPTMIQIANDGGLLPQGRQAREHAGRPRVPDAQRRGSGDGRVHLHRRDHGQDALPRARRARRRDRRLLAGAGRLQAHPLQRRPGARPQRGQPGGLLHRRRGPDRHRRRARHVAGYGPNTRTVLQFQVDGPAAAPFDLERLERALPAAYAAAQDPVLVPSADYDAVYGAPAEQETRPPPRGGAVQRRTPEAMQDGGMATACRATARPCRRTSRARSRSPRWTAATG